MMIMPFNAHYGCILFNFKRISSIDAVSNETPAEFWTLVLVHFHKVEFVLVELIGYLLPKTWLTSPKNLPNIATVFSIIANDISIEFARHWSSKSPP